MMTGSGFNEESFPEYVPMPWDDKTELFIQPDSNCDEMITRWEYIQMQLQSDKITNPNELIAVIKSYNVMHDGTGRQFKPPWKFTALLQYFEEVSETERNEFFKDGGILGTITNLALQSIELVPRVKLMISGFKSSITLHQLQIASLLANAFMCTYPKRHPGYPSINFNRLFEGPDGESAKPFIEKIKCIVHYFRRINEKQPTGNVSFHRLCILQHKIPRWDKTTASLCSLKVEIQGKIEDQEGFLQMDFANRFVGGGVLGHGCIQEEIRFIICPELIVARLFTQCLADNEALLVIGAERYCKYTGFSDTFRFDGDYRDATPFDESKHRKTYLIVLDALYFSHSSEQYRESMILRELMKAYVGFKPTKKSLALPLATGNWGCGAFRGDPQLKSILQLMASSQAKRDILYLTFGDSSLKKEIDDLYKLLKETEINVGTLYRIIRLYKRNKDKNQTLFEFIKDTIMNYRKRADVDKSAVGSVVRKEPHTSSMVSEGDLNCGSVEKKIRKFSVSDVGNAADAPVTDFGSTDSREPEVAGFPPESEWDVEMPQVPSPSLLSGVAKSGNPPCHVYSMDEVKGRKLVQRKITDCFNKT